MLPRQELQRTSEMIQGICSNHASNRGNAEAHSNSFTLLAPL